MSSRRVVDVSMGEDMPSEVGPYVVDRADRKRQEQHEAIVAAAEEAVAMAPPLPGHVLDRIPQLFRIETPPESLERYRLQLFCGHVKEGTIHRDHVPGEPRNARCQECGGAPQVVVARTYLGSPVEVPCRRSVNSSPPKARKTKRQLEEELAAAQERIAQLEGPIGASDGLEVKPDEREDSDQRGEPPHVEGDEHPPDGETSGTVDRA